MKNLRATTFPTLFIMAALAVGWLVDGPRGLLAVALLSVLEISISFDNAIVNVAVLRDMSPAWQRAFLTWGILIAVVGMRLLFPLAVVAVAARISPLNALDLAVNRPERFADHLHTAGPELGAFGGVFLLLVFLGYFVDSDKEAHWLTSVERRLSGLARIDTVRIGIAATALLALSAAAPGGLQGRILAAGVLGIIVHTGVSALADSLGGIGIGAKAGVGAFLYLEVLDASFSFDGVIGAFAVSRWPFIIAAGLGVGALFVRLLTVRLLRAGTLEEYAYLEHGAHWAIGLLGALLILSAVRPVPEWIPGLAGVGVLGLALAASVALRRRSATAEPTP